MTPEKHAEMLLIPRDKRNPDYGKPRTPKERIDWIGMLLRKNILMGYKREFWIETKNHLKKLQ